MSLAILAEAVARIEFKVDLALKKLAFLDNSPSPQLHFIGNSCPVCTQLVGHQIDLLQGVVVRMCGCTTGKLPPLFPLLPGPGPQNGNASSNPTSPASIEPEPEDSGRRKAR